MSLIKRTIVAASVIIFMTTYIAIPASAQERIDTSVNSRPGSGSEINPPTRQLGGRCDEITERIDNLIIKYDEKKEHHVERYNTLIARTREIITKADENGYDTSDVKRDLVVIEDKLDDIQATYNDFMETLNEAQRLGCDDHPEAFRAKVTEARRLLKELRTQTQEMRQFVRETLIPDIKALKDQSTIE